VSNYVVYEHPLNERIRTFLRLEYLFKKTEHFIAFDDAWATRSAVDAVLDIASITARADIKTEILKELERNASTLNRMRRQRGVDLETLGQVLENLEQATSRIYRLDGQIGQQIRENDFVKSVVQRSSIPGGTCSFDLPQFHHWLQQSAALRRQQLQDWMIGLEPVRDSLYLLLSLTRSSNTPRRATAARGFFQDSLDVQAPAQMVRVALDPGLPLFPEVSGHKNRFSIRFMESLGTERPSQAQSDVDFLLTCCVI
jgi:cell division protein ZapD